MMSFKNKVFNYRWNRIFGSATIQKLLDQKVREIVILVEMKKTTRSQTFIQRK